MHSSLGVALQACTCREKVNTPSVVSLQAGTRRDDVNPPGGISLKPSAGRQYVPLALVILNQSTAVGHHVHDPLAVALQVCTCREEVNTPSVVPL